MKSPGVSKRSAQAAAAAMALLLLASPVLANEIDRVRPREAPPNPPAQLPAPPPFVAPTDDDSPVVVDQLRGLVFVPGPAAVRQDGVVADGVVTAAVPLLDVSDFRARLEPLLGQPVTLARIELIRELTVDWYRENDRPFVDVVVPEQTVEGGTIQIVAMEYRAGQVSVAGAKWFAADRLAGQTSVRPGGAIFKSSVLEDIDWLNVNPFRRAEANFTPGANIGETDVTYRVEDRLPLRVFGGLSNNGSRTTDRRRISTGFQWGDAFWVDHQLAYTFTVSPDRERFQAHSASYRIPLPWRDMLVFSGAWSKTVPRLDNASFGQDARSWNLSGTYQWRLPRIDTLSHRLELGPQFKRSTSNLDFFGTPVLTSATDIFQMVAAYEADMPDDFGASSWGLALVGSPGGVTGDNTTTAFRPSATSGGRTGATAEYVYATAHFDRTTRLPEEFSLLNRLRGQVSNRNLLSSEQFNLGGASSLRGYDESAVNGDHGLALSTELRSPEVSISWLTGLAGVPDRLQGVVFWDYGVATLHKRSATDPGATYLSSVGFGLRYAIDRFVNLSADVGFPLIPVSGGDNQDVRLHLNLNLAY